MAGWSSLNVSKSQCACSCPSSPCPRPHRRVRPEKPRLATLDAQPTDGTYDSGTLMHQGPWETLFLTIEVLVNSKTSMAECIVPPLVGAAVEGRDRTCPRPRRWAGLGTQGSGQHSPPPHTKPCITSEEQQQGMGSDTVKNQVPKLDIIPTVGYNSNCRT